MIRSIEHLSWAQMVETFARDFDERVVIERSRSGSVCICWPKMFESRALRNADRLARVAGLRDLQVERNLTQELDFMALQDSFEAGHRPKDFVIRVAFRALK
jgi:hypothetical protein